MPGPMPYYLEKGYTMSLLESAINDVSDEEVRTLFDMLSDETRRLTDTPFFDSPSLRFREVSPSEAVTEWTPDRWKRHVDEHWFGLIDDTGASAAPRPAPSLEQATSWWIDYWGDDVEGIVRKSILLAIRTAYRVDDGQPLPGSDVERWPIDFFWKCGQAWFESWVTWRRLPPDRGLVTVIFCTPAENTGNHFLWWSPIPATGDAQGKADPYDKGLTGLGEAKAGMIVVTHTKNLPMGYGAHTINDEMMGRLAPPPIGTIYHGSGPVVAVQPSAPRGGVSSAPPTWQRPPSEGDSP
jgi:hypothetical protein